MTYSDKRIAVLIAPGFEDSELVEPVRELKKTGAKVTLIGLAEDDKRGVRGKRGTVVPADVTIDEVSDNDFDALVIPGGKSPAHLRRDERILDFVRNFNRDQKPIAAICHGPQVLISAGIMAGRTATSFFTVSRELKQAGANYTSGAAVKDANLVTSRSPKDIPAFINAILKQLDGRERKIA